jgi:hypothetical protein
MLKKQVEYNYNSLQLRWLMKLKIQINDTKKKKKKKLYYFYIIFKKKYIFKIIL